MSSSTAAKRLCSLALLVLCLLVPPSAHALEFPPGSVTLELLDREGEAQSRAGSHPDRLIQAIEFADPQATKEEPKDMVIDLPPGLGGDPSAVPQCPRPQFDETGIGASEGCPPASQIGVVYLTVSEEEGSTPLYDVEPGPNEVAMFGAVGFPPLKLIAHLRPADLGLSMRLSDIAQSAEQSIAGIRIELWGIPAEHQEGTSIPRKALLTLPSRCDQGPLSATVSMHTWQQPERWVTGSGNSGHSLTGCGDLGFDPQLAFSLASPHPDTPSGASVELTVPQNQDPDGLATSQVKEMSVLLPAGMTVSPGGAQGLASCSDAQIGLGTDADPTCPTASKVGTLTLDVPALEKPMTGSIYLGQERPGERFRLFMAASAKGSEVKLAGALQPDPQTGQLTATLKNLPESSFSQMSLAFNGGPNALLATPLACGPATARATIAPYSATPAVARSATANISAVNGGCSGPAPFAPTLLAGSTKTRPGKSTAFTATVSRKDGEALPERLSLTLPAGMSAALGTVTPCSGAALANASCPAASQLGSAIAELGPGSNPAQIQGAVFLTGPYRHSPFGLQLAFKAKLGPFDLGTLQIRAALRIDPQSGQVTIATDPLPSLFEGIPIRFQTIGLDLDRPGFIANPTSCVPTKVNSTLSSQAGASAHPFTPFDLNGCINLPFHPKLAMSLGDKAELHKGGHPALTIVTKLPPKGANLRSLQIALPRLLGLDSSGLRELCARDDALRGNCPKGSMVGTASARTPLLKGQMKGQIYLAQPKDNGPPDLWTELGGQGIEVNLQGQTSTRKGQTLTSFPHAPDFPLGVLRLSFAAGRHGVLALGGDPCRGLSAPATMGGQNGASVGVRVKVGVGCG